jgi:hypothetical protein
MPLYYFHLRDGTDTILDPEGSELAADAVAGKALWQARDCLAGDVKSGRLDLRYHIEVHDEAGETVHSIAFADALEIIPPDQDAS